MKTTQICLWGQISVPFSEAVKASFAVIMNAVIVFFVLVWPAAAHYSQNDFWRTLGNPCFAPLASSRMCGSFHANLFIFPTFLLSLCQVRGVVWTTFLRSVVEAASCFQSSNFNFVHIITFKLTLCQQFLPNAETHSNFLGCFLFPAHWHALLCF